MQATQPWEDGPSRQEEERDGRLRPNEMPSRRPGCRRGKRGRGVLFLVLAAAVFLGVLFSPVFSVTEITVDGESHYSEEEIRTFAGATVGMNLFAFSSHQAEENLCQQSYIKDATVEKVFPDQVHITVTERRVRGYIPYMGAYLYIDDEGRVLEIKSSYTEPLPLIKGLSFDEFTLGQVIETDNPEALDVMVRISQAMTKYDLLDLVVELDVSDPDQIKAYVNQVEINLGDISDYDAKIRTMAEIIREIPEQDRGTLDLSDLSKPLVFQYLT